MLPGWQVSSFLSSLYYLFKDAPARREDFVTISGSSLMPLKFVSHRWLENWNGLKESVCWKRSMKSKKKKRIDAEIKSLKDTADEFCTKVEATAKLTFVTQANAICKGQT